MGQHRLVHRTGKFEPIRPIEAARSSHHLHQRWRCAQDSRQSRYELVLRCLGRDDAPSHLSEEGRGASSVDADGCAEGFADRPVQHEVGDRVEARRLAVDDDQGGAVALGELRKGGRRIDDE